MPNSREHGLIGGVGGIASYTVIKYQTNQPLSLGGLFGSFLWGAIGGQLLDIIEPPVNPNHRGVFHSWAFLGVLADLYRRIQQSDHLSNEEKNALSILIVAMASHIIADSLTPKGVPFIGL